MSRVRVFIACSLDGFIAGPDSDLSWLPTPPEGNEEDFGWNAFISTIGCILMGRDTYDSVAAMGIEWPHKHLDTIVATTRPLDSPPPRLVCSTGSIGVLVDLAKEKAGGQDVYIDGGNVIRQALDANLVEELVVTICPTILGSGSPLFAGVTKRQSLKLLAHRECAGNVVQLTYEQRP